MAEIMSNSASSQAPYTPTKSNINVSSSEVAPDYSPAPEYNAKSDDKTQSQVSVYGPSEIANLTSTLLSKMMPIPDVHPILPEGNPLVDVRTHLSCHQNLNTNISVLLDQYKTMRKDLDQARVDLVRAQQDLRIEQAEKEAAQAEVKTLQQVISELVEDLKKARDQLAQTEARLSLAVAQLADTVRKLEAAKSDLRLRTRERDEFERRLQAAERSLKWYEERCNELQTALDLANKGEDAANDRNTQLTSMLYAIEASKAHIEREKDRAQAEVRGLRKELLEGGTHKKRIEQLESQIWMLNERNVSLQVDVNTLQAQKGELGRTIDNLKGEVRHHKDFSKIWQDLVTAYEKASRSLPRGEKHQHCRDLFKRVNPPVRIMSSGEPANEEIAPEPTYHTQEQTDVAIPEQVAAKEEAKEEPTTSTEPAAVANGAEPTTSTDGSVFTEEK